MIYNYVTDNGLVEMTPEQAATYEALDAERDTEYWANTPYEDAVDAEIRKKYSVSAEFAILRQKDEKPDEYAEYYAYCEECKALVKEKKSIVTEEESVDE